MPETLADGPGTAMPSAAVRRDGVLVLTKVGAILQAFSDGPRRAGPSEIASRIGANKSTTYRLLSSMERVGLLDRYPDGTFALGLWLMELGSLVQDRLDLRLAAEPELRALQQATSQTVFLTVRRGHEAICIDRLPGLNVDVLALRLGGVFPLYLGAGPRALLASLAPAELDVYLDSAPFPALTRYTLTTRRQLREDVVRALEQGYVLSMEDVTLGVGAVGAPVRDATGFIVAAVSVAGLKHEFEGRAGARVAVEVRSTADRVSAALGQPGSALRPARARAPGGSGHSSHRRP